MPETPLPPKTKFAAGLLILCGLLALFAAAADVLWFTSGGKKASFDPNCGYDERKGSNDYHFQYRVTGSGTGADRALWHGVAALAGFGFLTFGSRLYFGSAQTVFPAAGLAVLVGLGLGLASAQAASSGRATIGLPGMGLAFILLLAACLLVAGRSEHLAWRKLLAPPRRTLGTVWAVAGILLVLYGLATFGMVLYQTGSWLKPVRGQPTIGLRAEVSASTSLEFLGNAMKSAAEKSGSFTPGPGYFLHPQAFAAGWGGAWLAVGLAVLMGRGPSPKFVGLMALASAFAVTAFAVLSLFAALPWYAALPDGVFPGCLLLILPGGLLLAGRPSSARPA